MTWPFLVLGLLLAFQSLASTTGANSKDSGGYAITVDEYQAFVDDFIQRHKDQARLPGVVIAIVRPKDVPVLKAYGYAEPQSAKPMSATDTFLRVASVSKLFTATAALQMVEKGLLDLDQDIKVYAPDVAFENPFDKGVTMRQLLTHTAGFDERFVGLVAHSTQELLPLSEYLRFNMPAVVYPPGDAINYSNHGFALAGYVLERIAGKSFPQLIREQIFQPLDMKNSYFDLPEGLISRVAQGHEFEGDRLVPVDMDYISTGPASSLVTTGQDIVAFMQMHLSDGKYFKTGQRLLDETTTKSMRQAQFSPDPSIPGIGYAFFRSRIHDVWTYSHGGEARGWTTMLSLFPESKVGLFICYNRFGSDTAKDFIKEFVETFKARLTSKDSVSESSIRAQAALTDDVSHHNSKSVERFMGFYRMVRHPHESFTKIGAILSGFAAEYFVFSTGGGQRLYIWTLPWLKQPSRKWQRSGPSHFLSADTGERLVFKTNSSGRIDYLAREWVPEGTFERIPWYESFWFHSVLQLVSMLILIWHLVQVVLKKTDLTMSNLMLTIAGAFSLLFVAGLGVFFIFVKPVEIAYGVPLFIRVLLFIPMLTAVIAALVPFVMIIERHTVFRTFSMFVRTISQLISLYAVLFVFYYWNLIGVAI